MKKVKIITTDHPRLNTGYVYNLEEATGGSRFTSLGGKHSVFISETSDYVVMYEVVKDYEHIQTGRTFHTETHIRIGERIAAELWRSEYIHSDETKWADAAAKAFLERWKSGFFRGESAE